MIINKTYARTGAVGPCSLEMQREFWVDPATNDVIDAPKWVPTGSHECFSLDPARCGHLILGETLRSIANGFI